MKCGNCGEEMKVQRSEPIRDKAGNQVGSMMYYVCKNNHIAQVPQRK